MPSSNTVITLTTITTTTPLFSFSFSFSHSHPFHSTLSPHPHSHRSKCLSLSSSSSPSDVVSPLAPPPSPPLIISPSSLVIHEVTSEDELWAAACLRVRTFNPFLNNSSHNIEEHKKHLAEREFEAMKERIAGKREGFRRVSCINATLPLSHLSSLSPSFSQLCSTCKFSGDGGERVVVGSLDLNNCLRLPDEITGLKPRGIGADFARAYLSNVCVAEELQRNGLGCALVSKAKTVAEGWGIVSLYVHVALDNEPARKLYMKNGFVHESDEPAWQARFLQRPQRILLWFGLPDPYNL